MATKKEKLIRPNLGFEESIHRAAKAYAYEKGLNFQEFLTELVIDHVPGLKATLEIRKETDLHQQLLKNAFDNEKGTEHETLWKQFTL